VALSNERTSSESLQQVALSRHHSEASIVPNQRYELIEQIASGDFATVYRARDNELGREVAVKQIHQQYLNDPAQLERYWQEAQLLASLENPYIMTIYDVVRERGWLVLELMRGNLKQQLAGEPIDLESLRLTLIYTLSALHFLHENGIIHGDVKPTNLLLDKNKRVKLGDFGIARRLHDNEGSMVKGTTKYMAPEVCSPELGAVGPSSDIYSLGFSAYELMCGSHFDDLFPGLKMYGRDEQVAWMMWQATLDQRLPEIGRVLQGVPEDLANTVQKMTEKDPAKRYKTAEKPMLELRSRDGETLQTSDEKEADVEADKQAKRKRMIAVGAFAGSALISLLMVVMMFIPTKEEPKPPPPPTPPTVGVFVEIAPEDKTFWIQPADTADPLPVQYNPDVDRVLINDNKADFADLLPNDVVTVTKFKSEDGKSFQNVEAQRAVAEQVAGRITDIDRNRGIITLSLAAEPGKDLEIYVPSTVKITLNGETKIGEKPFNFSHLLPQDRVAVAHSPGDHGREADSIEALRTVSFKGSITKLNTDRRELTATIGREASSPQRTFPLAEICTITLNGSSVIDGRELTLNSLEAGDGVTIEHDAEITAIAARREFTIRGQVAVVDQAIRALELKLDNYVNPIRFTLEEDCEIDFLASGEPVGFDFLRTGDTVQITHLSPDLKNPVARTLSIVPTPDRRTWAVVLGVQEYGDSGVSTLRYSEADAQAVHATLMRNYRTAEDQMFFELNPSQAALQRTLPNFLAKVPAGAQLIVYFVGHGYLTDDGKAVLAMKDFKGASKSETGVPLSWLVTAMENAPATEKLLLLDAAHLGNGKFQNAQPSTDKLVESLKPTDLAAPSTSVIIVANSSEGTKGIEVLTGGRGAFGTVIEKAFAGDADDNKDFRLSAEELIGYVNATVPELQDDRRHTQKPVAFLPNAAPERITEDYKDAVRAVLAGLNLRTLSQEFIKTYETAREASPDQPDIDVAFALVQLKQSRTANSEKLFEQIRAKYPERVTPYVALAWQNFNQKNYKAGVKELQGAVSRIDLSAEGAQGEFARYVYKLAGEMREFALQGAEPPLLAKDVAPLDTMVIAQGDVAKGLYAAGLTGVRAEFAKIDTQIKGASGDAARLASLNRDRKRLTYFTSLDFDLFERLIKAELVALK